VRSDGETGRLRGFVAELRLALGFLTILPVAPRYPADSTLVARSYGYFPLVGFLLGGCLIIEDYALKFLFDPALRSIILILSLVIITGAIHLDGVADTADALGAGRNSERALEVLRDSSIGTFGSIGLFFVLALKCASLAGLSGSHRAAALWLAPGLGRWAMVATSSGLDYLRAEGAGSALLDGPNRLALATALTLVGMIPAIPFQAIRAGLTAAAVVLGARLFYRRWLGGVTGDLIGAAGEIAEVAVFVAMAI